MFGNASHSAVLAVYSFLLRTSTLKKMLQIYEHGLLRSAEKMFGANNKDWILQGEKDPKHRSHFCTSWKAENGSMTLDWPS